MQFNYKGHEFAIENKLVEKLDIIVKRVTQDHPTQDAWIQNAGYEGEGKTNASLVEAAYLNDKTKRPINLFFKVSSCLRFAQSTEKQLIILDEPSFELISGDHATRTSKDFFRLTSTVRKKRHIFIINFTKFWKFPEFLVVDRCLCMIYLHSDNGKDPGRFLYIPKKKLERLWNAYQKESKRLYGALKTFGGRFPFIMEKAFDSLDITIEGKPHCTLADYNLLKDVSIASIGQQEQKSKKELEVERKLNELRYKISQLNVISREELAARLGISSNRLREWAQIPLRESIPLGNEGFKPSPPPIISNSMAEE